MTEDVSVVIADDHAVVRKGLRLLIEAEPGLRVVAEAGTVPDALRMAKAHRPNVLVLDLNMPGGSSLEAIPTLREEAPMTAIVAPVPSISAISLPSPSSSEKNARITFGEPSTVSPSSGVERTKSAWAATVSGRAANRTPQASNAAANRRAEW